MKCEPRNLPFELFAALAADAAPRLLTIEIETSSVDAKLATPYLEIIEIFIKAVRCQVLPALGNAECIWEGEQPVFDALRNTISARARVGGLAPEAFLVLVALLAQSAHAADPPKSVRLANAEVPGNSISAQRLLGLGWEELRNEGLVRSGEIAEGELLEINFEFRSPLPAPVVPIIDEALNVWDHLVFLGGYRLSFEPDEEFQVILGETVQLTRTNVRHLLDSFKGPFLAFDGLLRISGRLGRMGYPINEIVLES